MSPIFDTFDSSKMKYFPVCADRAVPNINRIYPIQQQYVVNIVSVAEKYNCIQRITIFGSSTSIKCTIDSDLDVCLETKKNYDEYEFMHCYEEMGIACDWTWDVLLWHSSGEQIKKVIEKEGVVVYESTT